MIKSTATKGVSASDDYPRLMISIYNETVVLFSKPKKGTVVAVTQGSGELLGSYSEGWSMDSFEPWSGKVVIEQD